jgi:hypothetical protein
VTELVQLMKAVMPPPPIETIAPINVAITGAAAQGRSGAQVVLMEWSDFQRPFGAKNDPISCPTFPSRHMRRGAFAIAVMMVGVTTSIASRDQQPTQDARPTIDELIARGAVGTGPPVGPSGPGPTAALLLGATDALVAGTVGQSSSYLSDDRRDIYTDYELVDPVVYFWAPSLTAEPPLAGASLTITQTGGTVTLSGVEYARPPLIPLERGTRGLFLLRRVGDKYQFAHQFCAGFRLEADGVTPLTVSIGCAPEYSEMPVAAIVSAMVATLREGHRPPQ